MLTQYYTLRALCAEIGPSLAGRTITEIYSQEKDELVIGFSGAPASGEPGGDGEESAPVSLVVSLVGGNNALFLDPGRRRAKRNTATLFTEVEGQKLIAISAVEFDRIVILRLSGVARFAVHLFDNRSSNVFLVGGPVGGPADLAVGRYDTVLAAFRDGKQHAGTSYREPGKSAGVSAAASEALTSQDGPISSAIKAAAPYLGKHYLAELFRHTAVDPAGPAASLSPDTAAGIIRTITGWNSAPPAPAIYTARETGEELLSMLPLSGGDSVWRSVAPTVSVNDAVLQLHRKRLSTASTTGKREALEDRLGAERRKLEKVIGAPEPPAGRAEEARRAGELILANIASLRKGMREALLEAHDGAEGPVKVKLDPSRTPAQNAEKYFSDSKKAAAADESDRERRREAAVRLKQVEEMERVLADADTAAGLTGIEKVLEGKVPVRQQQDAGPRLPYKEFDLGGGYVAWVGRSAADNDELTLSYAGPHDWWFHARGVSGSHVVLRTPHKGKEVPKEVKLKAARLAAYYSKMKKASNVPVSYCERKYVRKKKGSPAGTVMLSREEILFVRPETPSEG